jgi:hypothetical protein
LRVFILFPFPKTRAADADGARSDTEESAEPPLGEMVSAVALS